MRCLFQSSGGGRILCCGSALPQGVFQVVLFVYFSLTSDLTPSLPAGANTAVWSWARSSSFERTSRAAASATARPRRSAGSVRRRSQTTTSTATRSSTIPSVWRRVPTTQSSPAWKLFDISGAFHILHRHLLIILFLPTTTFIVQCHICGDVLRDRYLTFKDQPVCEKDFKVSWSSHNQNDTFVVEENWPYLYRVQSDHHWRGLRYWWGFLLWTGFRGNCSSPYLAFPALGDIFTETRSQQKLCKMWRKYQSRWFTCRGWDCSLPPRLLHLSGLQEKHGGEISDPGLQ